MYIKQSYDDDFEHFMLDMKDKYPKSIFELNGISDDDLDHTKFAKKYFTKKNTADISSDSNANVQIKNIATFNIERHKGSDKLDSLFLFWKTAKKQYGLREANRLVEKELCKDINIQDSSNFYLPYCFAFDTYDLLTVGLPFVVNYPSAPAKHSDAFWQHTIQLLQYAAPQMMGATAIPNFIVIYSGLIKYDSEDENYPIPNYKTHKKLFERYVTQRFQELVFTLNQPLRQVQSTFSNITIFDKFFMKEICSKYIIREDVIDYEFAMYIQKLFLETLNELNNIQIATYPILTAQFKKDSNGDIEDEEFIDFISKINLPTGHLNLFDDESLNALSSCCRLVNNIEDILKATQDEYMNLIGGSSVKVGSFGVTTLPLVRIALKSKKNEEEFFKLLEESAIDCYKINHCRRVLINEKIEQGQMPLYNHGFIDLKNQYSTLGINGFYECLYFMGYDLKTREGIEFGIKILQKLDEVSKNKIKKYGYRTNLEQIPAEQTSFKLAKADSILYNQNEFNLYGNQFIPLTMDATIHERIQIQAELEKYFSGGTILHCNFTEKIPSSIMMKNFIKHVAKSGVKYFAINYFFNICSNKHYTVNNKEICEICNEPIIDKMTRIVGFFVPISSWSKERVKEFNERKKYNLINIEDEK